MLSAMRAILKILGTDLDPFEFPWLLTYRETSAIRAALAERYSPATARHHLSVLKSVLRQCWSLELIDTDTYQRAVALDPIRGYHLPSGRALTATEIGSLFKACAADPTPAGRRDAALISLLAGCGLRAAELCGLDLADYNQDSGDLRVLHAKGNAQRMV
jgi:site-specific recombinase XerD